MSDVDANLEGYNTLLKTWHLFYNERKHNFLNKNKSEGSYDDSGKYTVWPLAVYLQALVDGCRIYPKELIPYLGPAFKVLEKYYTPKYRAYCASEYFNGNDDVYYDDNAQVASAFITAYEVTGDTNYLMKGDEVVRFLLTGYLNTAPGGVRWHVGKDGSNTCTTAESGLAAIRLVKFIPQNQQNVQGFRNQLIQYAISCCRWIFDKLQDPEDHLICDGLEPVKDDHGKIIDYKRNHCKWTYNQGTPLSLCAILYYVTRDDWYKEQAEKLADAATDRNRELFDRTPELESARFYHDSVYFYQLLAEGFADFILYFEGRSPEPLVQRVKDESLRNMHYVYTYLYDPNDKLYFQTYELFRIDKPHYDQYLELTQGKGARNYEPGDGEREKVDGVPVEKRKLTKSLIACGAVARIFFQSARLNPRFKADRKQ